MVDFGLQNCPHPFVTPGMLFVGWFDDSRMTWVENSQLLQLQGRKSPPNFDPTTRPSKFANFGLLVYLPQKFQKMEI